MIDFNIDLYFKISDVDEVSDCKRSMFKKIMKLCNQMQIFGEFAIQSLIPIGGRKTILSQELLKSLLSIFW